MKRRTVIRIFAFGFFAFAVLLARNIMLMRERSASLMTIKNGYTRAVEELSTAADNIRNTLQKQLYAGTADMHSKLSQQLWRDSSTAKAALAQLPVENKQLENTYKFLSQVGNYSLSLSEKLRREEKLSDEEYENLSRLFEFSKQLCDDMWQLENDVAQGNIDLANSESAASDESAPPTVTEGFEDFEEGFDSYPRLVYDGPFSDHIMEKTPLMTKNAAEVSREKARLRAASALGVKEEELTEVIEEGGKMPSYTFTDKEGTVACAVTKQGGFISYFLKSREVLSESISEEQALEAAQKCLDSIGIGNMKKTYYENINHVMTVNYAHQEGEVCCYTDLIKVSVAMDSGEVVGYDAQGYLVNHRPRDLSQKRRSILDLQKQVSPKLKVISRGLAVIPGEAQEERLCYEFKCEDENGGHVLVYFNALTGREEQILILFESEDGTPTV